MPANDGFPSKEARELAKPLLRLGWVVEVAPNTHLRWRSPGSKKWQYTASSSASRGPGLKDTVKKIRLYAADCGVELPDGWGDKYAGPVKRVP